MAVRLLAAAGFLGAWLTAGGGAPARADVIYRLMPALGLGITDNAASVAAPHVRDEMATAHISASARYTRALSSHGLDASLMYTRYIENHGPLTLTAMLAWTSLFKLSSMLDLGVGAQASISRAASVVTDVSVGMPTAYAVAPAYYVSSTANQTLTFQPTARQVYAESLALSRVSYLGSTMAPAPTTTVVSGKLRGGFLFARDTAYLEASVADAFSPDTGAPTSTATTSTTAGGQIIAAELMAGWAHTIGTAWSSQLAAGPLAIFQADRTPSYNVAAMASMSYHRLPWFASLSASQTPAPNVFIGVVTLNDEVAVRAALPFTRSQLDFVAGYAGYLYARIADAQGNFHHAFDMRTAGASVTSQFRNRPFAVSLTYTFTDQRGVAMTNVPALNIERQTLMLTAIGVFSWGPGTLPLFQGGLGQGGL